jgi:Ca2+-transporting ATPase
MDAFLHRRIQASTEGLSRQLAQKARVVRNGGRVEIPASELVPGDLVRVSTGESFPADGLIVAGENLQADESSLTGGAYPAAKRPLLTQPVPTPDSGSAIWIDGDHWGSPAHAS